ncbi:MAG: SdrD B-like domain-containing protein, partial [Clostridia bacterium]
SAKLTGTTVLGNIDLTSTGNTTLNGKSILKISKSLSPSRSSYNVLDQMYVALHTDAFTSAIVNPVFADLYPLGMTYKNNYYYEFTDAMTGTRYDSRQPGFPIPIPVPEVVPNYNGTGRTLVRVKFSNFTLLLRNQLNVYLDSIVSVGSPATVTDIGYLGNPGSNAEVDGTPYTDALDLDGDTITTEQIAQSAPVTFTVLSSSEFVIQKFVKGQLDSSYSDTGFTTAGGDIAYNLAVANNQNLTLKDIQIVDILPYVGDTGVILNTIPRGSQFDVYPTTAITADVFNLIGNPVTPPIIQIYYSTSQDPVRFDETGTGTIGTGSWSLVPPVDVTTIAAIKVVTDPTTILNPYDVLTVSIKAKAPVGVALGKIAYNSFAVMGNQVSGSTVTPLLPTEPNKVSAEIRSTTNASIGSFAWNDLNNSGLYEAGEPKMNGVTVELYDNAGNLLKSTITANDGGGNPGSYVFTDLIAGTYVVKFIPLSPYTLTVKTAGGSTPNQVTGLTDPIVLAGADNTTINAGIVGQSCPPPTINASDKCLHVGDTFNPLVGVTATDCAGKDITSSIIVTANNVNTAVVGVYSVTYSVTDSKNQTTLKTIAVKVCQGSAYGQAITDIIQSVALIQTAIAAVLDAEGAKVQKFMTLNPTPQQLIDVNKSVQAMTDTIKNLELVLQGKLNAVACKNCSGDCCQ